MVFVLIKIFFVDSISIAHVDSFVVTHCLLAILERLTLIFKLYISMFRLVLLLLVSLFLVACDTVNTVNDNTSDKVVNESASVL